jgi:SH3-like domain-containing protein
MRKTILAVLAAHVLTAGAVSPPRVVAAARLVRVKVDEANLRSGPSTAAETLRPAYENEPLQVLSRRGQWLRVSDFQGTPAWIYAPLTDSRPAVVVEADVANLRAGPGRGHEVLYTAERWTTFLVLTQRGSWIRVRHADGPEGWIHGTLLWGDP